MAIMKRIDVTLDPESLEILRVYKLCGYPASLTIRRALDNYYRFNKPKVKPGTFDGVDVTDESEQVYQYD